MPELGASILQFIISKVRPLLFKILDPYVRTSFMNDPPIEFDSEVWTKNSSDE